MVIAACPSCGASGQVPDEAQGHRARCSRCKTRFLVPLETTASTDLKETISPEMDWKEVTKPPPARTKFPQAIPVFPTMSSKWFYAHEGQVFGPTTAEDLKQLAAAGQLLRSDETWKEGMTKRVLAKKVKGLFEEVLPAKPVSAISEKTEPAAGRKIKPADKLGLHDFVVLTALGCIASFFSIRGGVDVARYPRFSIIMSILMVASGLFSLLPIWKMKNDLNLKLKWAATLAWLPAVASAPAVWISLAMHTGNNANPGSFDMLDRRDPDAEEVIQKMRDSGTYTRDGADAVDRGIRAYKRINEEDRKRRP